MTVRERIKGSQEGEKNRFPNGLYRMFTTSSVGPVVKYFGPKVIQTLARASSKIWSILTDFEPVFQNDVALPIFT